jgi:hypothetical protein
VIGFRALLSISERAIVGIESQKSRQSTSPDCLCACTLDSMGPTGSFEATKFAFVGAGNGVFLAEFSVVEFQPLAGQAHFSRWRAC